MAAGLAFVVRRSCPGRAFARLCAGGFLPGARPALVAATDATVALLVASEGAQDGEGQLEVVCEQPVFAAVRAVAPLPAGAPGEQDLLALLTDSGFLSILRFDAVLCRFVAVQQLALPPEPPGDPFRLLAVHPTGAAVAVASLMGSVCIAARQPVVPPNTSGSPDSAAAGSDGSAAGLFGSTVSLRLAHNLWSLAFATASASDAPAAIAAGATAAAAAAAAALGAAPAEPISLVALQQHPLSGAFAVAEYLCTAAATAGRSQPQLTAFFPLESTGTSSGSASTSQPGSPSSRAGAGSPQLGQPRALVQLPPAAEGWHPGACVLLRESGVQLISSGMQPAPEPATQAAERWWRQQEEQPAAAAATAAVEPAAAEEAARPQPMAVSLEQQPSVEGQLLRLRRQGSLEQLPDAWEESGEGEDVEMLEAAGSEAVAPAPAAEAEAAGAAEAADEPDEAAGEAAVSASPPARSASAAGKAALAVPANSSGQLVTCCCWEWPAPTGGQLDGQQPVLACALEDGSLWRLPLPSAAECSGSGGSCVFPCPARASGGEQQQQQRTAPAARSIAAVPGGLLCACTDCSGLQLLQLHPSGAYEPLLPALASAQQAAAGWDASAAAAACTLPAAAPVADCVLADLEGSGQAQLYAACCGTAGSGGRLCVLYPDPKPETVFELPGAAEGITGLWGLRQRTADRHHSLALLSFLGGSRLLAAQGGIFRDVTDCYPLHSSAQTLAAGNLHCPATAGTAGIAAQVTSHAAVLFATQPTTGLSRQASDALPFSAAPPNSSDASSSGVGAQPAWQPPAGCSIGAAVVTDNAVLLFCTGSSRQLVVLLPDFSAAAGSSGPGGEAPLPQLVAAAHMPLQADVSCISNLLEQTGAPAAEGQSPEQQAGQPQQRSAVFAVGTYSSSVLLVQLSWEAAQPAAASLSVMQAVDLTASSIAGSIPTAAAAAAAAAESAVPFSPRAFQREQLTPESLMVLPAPEVAAGAAAAGAPPAPVAAAATGGAASLLVGLRTGSLLQLRCSWGPQQAEQEELLAVPLGHMPAVLLPLPAQPSLATAAAGVPPPAAAALSDRVSLLHCPAAAAAGGGRVRCAPLALPQVQAAAPLLLESDNLANSTCMVSEAGWGGSEAALETAFGSSGAPTGVQPPAQQLQLFLLCAASDGCLRMLSLDPQQVASSRCWPLPHDLQPSRLIAHPASGCVAVAGASSSLAELQRARHRLAWDAEEEEEGLVAAVQLLDPGTGDLLASYTGFMPDESITALAVWDPAHPGPQQPPPGSLASSIEAAGTPAAGATPTEAAAAAGAAAAGSGAEVPPGGFIVVGTTVGYGEPPGDAKARWGGAPQGPPRWDDETSLRLQGRLLLLQVATPMAASAGVSLGGAAAAATASAAVPAEAAGGANWEPVLLEEQAPRRKLQLLAVAEMHLPNRVLALCPGSTRILGDRSSSSSSDGGSPRAAESRLFASVGRRVVSLEWRARQQMLRRVAWMPTARPITSLQLSGGLLAAADRREGVTLYRYFEPEPSAEAPPPHPDQRGRLARRYRLAPPAAGELRHRLGLAPQLHMRDGGTSEGAHSAAGQGKEPEEELEPGFSVVAADTCCRPAVGALVVPAAASAPDASSGSSAADPAATAAAAAALDAHGELRLLQQRWPGQQAALHQRCCFLLHEPAVALLPGSLGYQGEAAGGGALLGAAAAPTAAGAAAEMAAVTLGGSVLSLRPVNAADAAQLAALQRALASHPATAPLSGGSHTAYRGWEASGQAVPAVPLLFRHPVPADAKEGGAEAELLPPASPSGAAAAAQEGLLGSAMALEPAAPEAEAGPDAEAQPAAGGGTSPLPAGAARPVRLPIAAAGAATAAQPMDVILDGELLQQFLLLPPAEQRAVVAGMRGSGVAPGNELAAAELRRTTQRLNNLVASLML